LVQIISDTVQKIGGQQYG